MKASKFDEKFDSGEDITEFLDIKEAKRTGLETKRINIDLPGWMIESLDKAAHRIGTSRQSLIKFWMAEKLDLQHNH